MNARKVIIGKADAERLLARNTSNRKKRLRNVLYFIQCLKKGCLPATHQGIALKGTFEDPIRLFDGQHRLMAVQETNIPMESWVFENCDESCFIYADGGVPRSICDRTGFSGPRATLTSAFIQIANVGEAIKPSVGLFNQVDSIIMPHAQHVSDTAARNLSLAGFKCAFTLQQKVYGANLSSLFLSRDAESDELLIFTHRALYTLKMKQIRLSGEKCTLSHPEAFSTAWRQIEKQSSQKVHIEKNPLIASRQIITKHWPELVDAVNGWKR